MLLVIVLLMSDLDLSGSSCCRALNVDKFVKASLILSKISQTYFKRDICANVGHKQRCKVILANIPDRREASTRQQFCHMI